jgi:3-hydroxyacyl-CoA dehydrogenase/enoyl-CoA hydratase/3-hydroxybutyryl-CoA epimerase
MDAGTMDLHDHIFMERNDGVATLSLAFPSGNRFDLPRVRSLTKVISRLTADPDVSILTIRSADPTAFSRGFALTVGHPSQSEADRLALAAAGQKLTATIANASCITVAELAGPCLGPGFDLALACDYRLATATADFAVGFPESRVGLYPSWGGVERLLTKLGRAGAERLLASAAILSARDAYRCGLVDSVSCVRRTKIERQSFLDRLQAKPRKARRPGFFALRRHARAIVKAVPAVESNFLSPLRSLLKAASSSAVEGRVAERSCFAYAAASGPVQASFTLMRTAESPRTLPDRPINPVPDVPHVIALKGVEPGLAAIAVAAAIRGSVIVTASDAGQSVRKELEAVKRRGIISTSEAEQASQRIRESIEVDRVGLVLCDPLRDEQIGEIEADIPPRCLIAVANHVIEPLQHAAIRPGRVIGLGLPIPGACQSDVMELACGPETSSDTAATLVAWLRTFGFSPIVGADRHGLTVRRVLAAYWDEAVRLVSEGISPETLDAAVRANGTRIGPLEQLDEIGFDLAVGYCRRLVPLLAAGLTGRAGGHAFYRYKRGRRTGENRIACSLLWDARSLADEGPRDPLAHLDLLTPKQALTFAGERLTLRIVNEAAGCLYDDCVAGPAEIDLAVARGSDLLPYAGGPLRFAERRGLDWVTAKLIEYSKRIGPRFTPSPELVRRAAGGEGFYTSNVDEMSVARLAIKAA